MPTTASRDTINDAAFRTQFDNLDASASRVSGESRRLPDRFDPLDKAFPFAGDNSLTPGSARNPPAFHPMHADAAARESIAQNESGQSRHRVARRYEPTRIAIALVVATGLAVGAAAAVFVFNDRVAQILGTWSRPTL